MDELVQRVHPVAPGFDPTQLGLCHPEPSTHGLLRKRLVPMRRVDLYARTTVPMSRDANESRIWSVYQKSAPKPGA